MKRTMNIKIKVKMKIKMNIENFVVVVPLFTALSKNGRFPSEFRVEQVQHKCAALPREMAIFVFFVRTA